MSASTGPEDRTPQEIEADGLWYLIRYLTPLWEDLDSRREDHILWANAADYVSMAMERLEQAQAELRRDFEKVES